MAGASHLTSFAQSSSVYDARRNSCFDRRRVAASGRGAARPAAVGCGEGDDVGTEGEDRDLVWDRAMVTVSTFEP